LKRGDGNIVVEGRSKDGIETLRFGGCAVKRELKVDCGVVFGCGNAWTIYLI
jgi:hypothetical protein